MDIIGIDIGGTNIKGSLFRNRKMVKSLSIQTQAKKPGVLKRVCYVISLLKTPATKGIGIGFPAPIENGKAYEVQNIPQLNGINLQSLIQKKYKVKCRIENDANCFTLAQSILGEGKNHHTVVGITLGTGIGIGVVQNKKIIAGKRGIVGELGRTPYKNSTIEQYTSAKFFKSYRKTPEQLAALAKKGDKNAKKVFEEYGKHLAAICAIVTNAYDPDIIILGGKISLSYSLFISSLKKELKKYLFSHAYKNLKIKPTMIQHSSEQGAALLLN